MVVWCRLTAWKAVLRVKMRKVMRNLMHLMRSIFSFRAARFPIAFAVCGRGRRAGRRVLHGGTRSASRPLTACAALWGMQHAAKCQKCCILLHFVASRCMEAKRPRFKMDNGIRYFGCGDRCAEGVRSDRSLGVDQKAPSQLTRFLAEPGVFAGVLKSCGSRILLSWCEACVLKSDRG